MERLTVQCGGKVFPKGITNFCLATITEKDNLGIFKEQKITVFPKKRSRYNTLKPGATIVQL